MKIVMIGTGYVASSPEPCLQTVAMMWSCVDIDQKKVERLKKGEIPIYEPAVRDGHPQRGCRSRLKFTTQVSECVPTANCVFLVWELRRAKTAPPPEVSLLSCRLDCSAPLEDRCGRGQEHRPRRTNRKVANRLKELLGRDVDVASNPEFLKEGCAIDDFTKPDRVVVGSDRTEPAETLAELYKPFLRTERSRSWRWVSKVPR